MKSKMARGAIVSFAAAMGVLGVASVASAQSAFGATGTVQCGGLLGTTMGVTVNDQPGTVDTVGVTVAGVTLGTTVNVGANGVGTGTITGLPLIGSLLPGTLSVTSPVSGSASVSGPLGCGATLTTG